MKRIAIITARGGSKRIPHKNIKDFCGQPIIAYSILAAKESGLFDEVMVSTDSEQIAEIALKYGAVVPFYRSVATSNDYATTADVLKEVLAQYRGLGKEYDVFCCLYPTAPFVTSNKLRDAEQLLREEEIDAVIPVVKFDFPPQRGFILNDNNHMQYWFPEHALTRSQDLKPIYHDCGQFYFCKTEAFLREGVLILPKALPYIMPDSEVQDIDTLEDWKIAEQKYLQLVSK